MNLIKHSILTVCLLSMGIALTGCGGTVASSSNLDSSVVGTTQDPPTVDTPPATGNVNQPPTAAISAPSDYVSGETITLDGSGSSDPDGDTLSFLWTQTQGSDTNRAGDSSPSISFVAPSVAQPAQYTFQLTVNDGELSDTAEVSFLISPVIDSTAPSIVSRSPQVEQTDVSVTSQISVTFDEALLETSVDTTSLSVQDNANYISGNISYDGNTNSILFIPATQLSDATTYTVTLGSSIQDPSGNSPLPESWSFTTATTPALPAAGDVALEGYGTNSSFGEASGYETCVVSNLDDSGTGSLRDCILNRNGAAASPVPRKVVFTVGGTITLLSDIFLNQPDITIDGLSAPNPGITITKTGDGTNGEFRVNTWPEQLTCAHDVLIQGLRFVGVWDTTTEFHSQNAVTISIDGEDYVNCVDNIVFNRITITNAQDAGGDIWGSVKHVTYQYSAFINSLHPQSHSHAPGGVAGQERRYISIHHNLYAYNHERQTNIRGNTWDYNFEQNILHAWDPYGFGGGYATQFRCRNGGCPERVNLIDNFYTSSPSTPTGSLSQAVVFTDSASTAQVYMRDNRFPAEETDRGTAASEFSRSAEAAVTLYPHSELSESVLPYIGAPYRTVNEEALFLELADQIQSDL